MERSPELCIECLRNLYDGKNVFPMVTACGHSICSECCNVMNTCKVFRCPTCKADNQIQGSVRDETLCRVLRKLNNIRIHDGDADVEDEVCDESVPHAFRNRTISMDRQSEMTEFDSLKQSLANLQIENENLKKHLNDFSMCGSCSALVPFSQLHFCGFSQCFSYLDINQNRFVSGPKNALSEAFCGSCALKQHAAHPSFVYPAFSHAFSTCSKTKADEIVKKLEEILNGNSDILSCVQKLCSKPKIPTTAEIVNYLTSEMSFRVFESRYNEIMVLIDRYSQIRDGFLEESKKFYRSTRGFDKELRALIGSEKENQSQISPRGSSTESSWHNVETVDLWKEKVDPREEDENRRVGNESISEKVVANSSPEEAKWVSLPKTNFNANSGSRSHVASRVSPVDFWKEDDADVDNSGGWPFQSSSSTSVPTLRSATSSSATVTNSQSARSSVSTQLAEKFSRLKERDVSALGKDAEPDENLCADVVCFLREIFSKPAVQFGDRRDIGKLQYTFFLQLSSGLQAEVSDAYNKQYGYCFYTKTKY